MRRTISDCVQCSTFSVKPNFPLMGNLPKSMTLPSIISVSTCKSKLCRTVPLLYCATNCRKILSDTLRPLFEQSSRHWSSKNLDNTGFHSCSMEFVSRQCCPTHLNTENGSNFHGAKRLLLAIQKVLKAGLNMILNVIPPLTLHLCGSWDSSVKNTGRHLKKTLRNKVLSFEELTTLFCQFELLSIFCPSCQISDDPNDSETLKPAHF